MKNLSTVATTDQHGYTHVVINTLWDSEEFVTRRDCDVVCEGALVGEILTAVYTYMFSIVRVDKSDTYVVERMFREKV